MSRSPLRGTVRRWISWQRVPVTELTIRDPRAEMWTALAYAAFYILLAIFIGFLISVRPMPIFDAASLTDDVWYVLVFKLGFLLAIPLVWFHWKGYRISALMPQWRPSPRAFIAIALALFAGLSLNLLQGRLDQVVAAAGNFSRPEFLGRIVFGILIALAQAGFPEEFVFRGILQTRIERVWGRAAAILISVVLFTAWHIPTRYFNSSGVEGSAGDLMSVVLGTGIPVMIVALVFGLIWDRYRSFLPLVAAHWGVDILPSVLSYLKVSY